MSPGPAGQVFAGTPDAAVFLARLTRIDPGAVVRLRAAAPGRTALWGRLPWSVLVSRTVSGTGPDDATVSAAALLAEIRAGGVALPPRQDAAWRWPLPPSSGQVVETVAAADVHRLAAAAAQTLRVAMNDGVGGRAIGQRVLRDALLDHVAVVVSGEPEAEGAGLDSVGQRVEVPQRLVQAILRMGFLGPAPAENEKSANADVAVQVRLSGRWVGLGAPYGVSWLPKAEQLTVTPIRGHTKV